jgi:hypothetical protein
MFTAKYFPLWLSWHLKKCLHITQVLSAHCNGIYKNLSKEKALLRISTGLEHFIAFKVFLNNVFSVDWIIVTLLHLRSQPKRV